MRLLQTQESVNPYQDALVPANYDLADIDGTTYPATRGIAVGGLITFTATFASGATAQLKLSKGIYNLSLTAVDNNADIVFLY